MLSVLGFLIILGPLVIFHEFGHYIFARIFGVKAEIFSIGFGPKLWSKQLGETELRVSAVPLGGYVKLLGEDREASLPPEEQRRSLHRQAAWKRFFIFFGGPLFNFVLAVLIFMAILAIGEPQTANVVGRVVNGSRARKAGFVSGDRILSVQGKPVKRFDEIASIVGDNPGKSVTFEVRHPGASAPARITVTASTGPGYSVYGEAIPVGQIDGLLPIPRGNVAGVSDPGSLAAKAGIRTGEEIVEYAGTPVSNWEELESLYSKTAPGARVPIRFRRMDEGSAPGSTAFLTKPAIGTMSEAWGLHSSELFVDKTVPKSPAETAEIRHGDRLIAVDGNQVQSFLDLRDAVQKSGEKTGKVPLEWEHDGKMISKVINPTATTGKDPELKTTTQYTIGVMPILSLGEPVTIVERIWNPFVLLGKGVERMVMFTWRNLVSVGKIITGDVSVGTLGGPILIGKIAGESLTHGLIAFLSTMAILSIGLGVLNVLPVPVLDGGHLLLLGIESIRGKPLTMRQMEVVQTIGLVLILALMGLVLKNDISRLATF